MAPTMRHAAAPDRRRRPAAILLALSLVAAVALAAGIGLMSVARPDAHGPVGPAAGESSAAGRSSAATEGTSASAATARPASSRSPSAPQGSGGPRSSPPVQPAPSSVPALGPPPGPGPFAIDLYPAGAFVHEATKDLCVAAAMQTMLNIATRTTDTTRETQDRLYALARSLSPKTLRGPGAEPEGWARGLTALGAGRYAVSVRGSMINAVRAAARALRLTGRPVGLLAWYGAHALVMSGFTASADPAWTDAFTVTGVYIEDVWYPSVSSIWGSSRPPDTLVPIGRLARDFLPWRMPGGPYPDKAWKFVTVVPVVGQG